VLVPPPSYPAPLYDRVRRELERTILALPLVDASPIPPEPKLMEQFGVSRGTVRRAIAELADDGLLRVEQGRGTYVNHDERIRRVVRERLAAVALPDSRFDLDLKQFVPDFAGRAAAEARVTELPAWRDARTVFLAPDNSLEQLRLQALEAGKKLLVPTYGMRRDFVLLDGAGIAANDRPLAATLDGMERFGRRIDATTVASVDRVDVFATGATAVTTDGRHIGSGWRFLALEWFLLEQEGIVDDAVPVVAVVHDCQVIDEPVQADPDCIVGLIATPTRLIPCSPPTP
jgi:5-formyltetrahydrofolate cyclo-ligase